MEPFKFNEKLERLYIKQHVLYRNLDPDVALEMVRDTQFTAYQEQKHAKDRFAHFKSMTPQRMKQQVLQEGVFYIQFLRMHNARDKETKLHPGDFEVMDKIFPLLKKIIMSTKDEQPTPPIHQGETADRVDSILKAVVDRIITPQRGKTLIQLVQSGLDLSELALELNPSTSLIIKAKPHDADAENDT